MRQCAMCLIKKEISHPTGYCIPCRRQYAREYRKIYYKANKDKIIEYANWRNDNTEKGIKTSKAYCKKYQQNNKDKINKSCKKRRKKDPLFKLAGVLRQRTRKLLKIKNFIKTQSLYEYIGCSIEQLKIHLENKFQKGMTWNNHGQYGWHIDHIIPLSSAKTKKGLYKLCHYTNLQPLWAIDNLIKGDKLV